MTATQVRFIEALKVQAAKFGFELTREEKKASFVSCAFSRQELAPFGRRFYVHVLLGPRGGCSRSAVGWLGSGDRERPVKRVTDAFVFMRAHGKEAG